MAANRAARLYADAHRHPAHRYAHARAYRYIHARANPHRYARACRCARGNARRSIHSSAYARCARDNAANAHCCARYSLSIRFGDERLLTHYGIG